MQKFLWWFIGFMGFSPAIIAQNNQYNFAQTYFGGGFQYLQASGATTILNGSTAQKTGLPGKLTPYLDIGGMHFWGHADFYVSFYLPGIEMPGEPAVTEISTGIMTGARYYPWKIRKSSLRPFGGVNWSSISYEQQNIGAETTGPLLNRQALGVEGGVSYISNKYRLLEAALLWLPKNDWRYPISRTGFTTVQFPEFGFSFKYKYLLDFTQHAGTEASRAIQQQLLEKYQKHNAINAFSVAVGVSSAFALSSSEFLEKDRPFLAAPLPINIFPDLALGYYMQKPDLAFRAAFRPMQFSQQAYGFQYDLSRKAFSVEAFKFILNYKGFVPFIGMGANYELLKLKEKDRGETITDIKEQKWSWSIAAGWDIRPTDVEWFILRTNIRYTPGLFLKPHNSTHKIDHLELNFIQLVLYPQRMKVAWSR